MLLHRAAFQDMLWVYFDTNVFDHIDKGLITSDEVGELRTALASKRLGAHLSIADVEELLGQWQGDRAAALRKLRLAGDLIGFDRLLLSAQQILEEAIRAYAEGAPPPSMLAPRRQRLFLSGALSKIAAGRAGLSGEVSKIVGEVRALKEKFRDGMQHGRGAELAERIMKTGGGIPPYTFQQVWDRHALGWAEGFAARSRLLEQCRERGLGGLLDVRPVRIAVGAGMSLVYSQVVERRKSRASDAYDLWHAVMASSADIFVTRDETFARLLAQVPIDGLRVVTSIPALLERVEARGG